MQKRYRLKQRVITNMEEYLRNLRKANRKRSLKTKTVVSFRMQDLRDLGEIKNGSRRFRRFTNSKS